MQRAGGGGEHAWRPFKAQHKTTVWTLCRGWKHNGWGTFFGAPPS